MDIHEYLASLTPHPFDINNGEQEEIDQDLLNTEIIEDGRFYVDYLDKQIQQLLQMEWKNYNKSESIFVEMIPISKKTFETLFSKAMKHQEKTLNKQTEDNSKIKFKVNPIYLSYLFGKGWWSIETQVDKKSKAKNGTFAATTPIRITYDLLKQKLRISFRACNVNTYGVEQ